VRNYVTDNPSYLGNYVTADTVAWTDDARLVVSTVQSGAQGPTFDELYAWWSSHS